MQDVADFSSVAKEQRSFLDQCTPRVYNENQTFTNIAEYDPAYQLYHLDCDHEDRIRYESRKDTFDDGKNRQGGHGTVKPGSIQTSRSIHPSCDGMHAHRSLTARGMHLPPYPLHTNTFSLLDDISTIHQGASISIQPKPLGAQSHNYTPTHFSKAELYTIAGESSIPPLFHEVGSRPQELDENEEEIRHENKRRKLNKLKQPKDSSESEDEKPSKQAASRARIINPKDPRDIIDINRVENPRYDLPSAHVYLHQDFEFFYNHNIDTLFSFNLDQSKLLPQTMTPAQLPAAAEPEKMVDSYDAILSIEGSENPHDLDKRLAKMVNKAAIIAARQASTTQNINTSSLFPTGPRFGKLSMHLSDEDQELLTKHAYIEKISTFQQTQRILDRTAANCFGLGYAEYVNTRVDLPQSTSAEEKLTKAKLLEETSTALTIAVDYPLRLRQLDAYSHIDDPELPTATTTVVVTDIPIKSQADLVKSQVVSSMIKPDRDHPLSPSISDTSNTRPVIDLQLPQLGSLRPEMSYPAHRLPFGINPSSQMSCYQSPYSVLYPYYHNYGTRGEPVAIKTALMNPHFIGLSYDHLREMIFLQHTSSAFKPEVCTNCLNKWLLIQNPKYVHDMIKISTFQQYIDDNSPVQSKTTPTPTATATTQSMTDMTGPLPQFGGANKKPDAVNFIYTTQNAIGTLSSQNNDLLALCEQAQSSLSFSNRHCLCSFHSISYGFEVSRWELSRQLRLKQKRFDFLKNPALPTNPTDSQSAQTSSSTLPPLNLTDNDITRIKLGKIDQLDKTDNVLLPFTITTLPLPSESSDIPTECRTLSYLSTPKEISARLLRPTLSRSHYVASEMYSNYQQHWAELDQALYKDHPILVANNDQNSPKMPSNINYIFENDLKCVIPPHSNPQSQSKPTTQHGVSPKNQPINSTVDIQNYINQQLHAIHQLKQTKLFQHQPLPLSYPVPWTYTDITDIDESFQRQFAEYKLKDALNYYTLLFKFKLRLYHEYTTLQADNTAQSTTSTSAMTDATQAVAKPLYHRGYDFDTWHRTGARKEFTISHTTHSALYMALLVRNLTASQEIIRHLFSPQISSQKRYSASFSATNSIKDEYLDNVAQCYSYLRCSDINPKFITQFSTLFQPLPNSPTVSKNFITKYLLHSFQRFLPLTIAPPNVLSTTLYDTICDGELMVSMEMMRWDLEKIIRGSHDQFCTYHIKRIFWMICQSLAVFHRRYLLHRDIKPSNVLVKLPRESHSIRVEPHRHHVRKITGENDPNPQDIYYTFGLDPVSAPSVVRGPYETNFHERIDVYEAEIETKFSQHLTRPIHDKFNRHTSSNSQFTTQRPLVSKIHQADPKLSNYELNNVLCSLADFGGIRGYGNLDIPLSPQAYTSWYRPPELCLKSRQYSYSADIWAMGCILGELMLGKPLFDVPYHMLSESPPNESLHQFKLMLIVLGPPSAIEWAEMENLPNHPKNLFNSLQHNYRPTGLDKLFQECPLTCLDGLNLLKGMLAWNPRYRPNIEQVLQHPWFDEIRI